MSERWSDEIVERAALAYLAHNHNHRQDMRAALDSLGPDVVVLSPEQRKVLLWVSEMDAEAYDETGELLRSARSALEKQ